MGVKGITLSSKDDRLVGMLLIKREGTTVLVATEKGFGKRTEISQYRAQKRGGKGVLTMKTTDKVGKMVTIKEVVDKDDLMIITNQGVLIRQPVSQIRAIGRATQGVKLIKLGEGTLVSSITRIMSEEDDGEQKSIAQNLKAVQNSLPKQQNIKIVVVTKTRTPKEIEEAIAAGARFIGENRVQEAENKFSKIKNIDLVEKRLIGSLQTNKVNKAVKLFDVIDSVDSLRLASKISKAAQRQHKKQRVLCK